MQNEMMDAALMGVNPDHPVYRAYQSLVATKAPNAAVGEWFRANHGRTVTTVQITPRGVWSPTGRVIDAHRAKGSVRLGESRRDYAGLQVNAVSDSALLVTEPDGFKAVILYVIEDGS